MPDSNAASGILQSIANRCPTFLCCMYTNCRNAAEGFALQGEFVAVQMRYLSKILLCLARADTVVAAATAALHKEAIGAL